MLRIFEVGSDGKLRYGILRTSWTQKRERTSLLLGAHNSSLLFLRLSKLCAGLLMAISVSIYARNSTIIKHIRCSCPSTQFVSIRSQEAMKAVRGQTQTHIAGQLRLCLFPVLVTLVATRHCDKGLCEECRRLALEIEIDTCRRQWRIEDQVQ
jgi:hypothetical protein